MPENLSLPDQKESLPAIPLEGQVADRGVSLIIERMRLDVDGIQENPVAYAHEGGETLLGDAIGESASGVHLLVWPPGGRARVNNPDSDTRMFVPDRVPAGNDSIRPMQ